MIINDDGMLDSIDEELDHVDTSCVDGLCHKHILNAFWELGKRTQDCEEVAITQRPLVDVIWLNAS